MVKRTIDKMDGIGFKPPKNVVFNKDAYENLENFLKSLDIYMRATGLDGKEDSTKVAILLNLAGEEAQKRFRTFGLSEEKKKKFTEVVKAFQDYCKPLRNETYDRYKFFTRVQHEGESFDHFITEVKTLAAVCNFGTLEESLIRDKIVSGIKDLSLQERLLQQSKLTLNKAEEVCLASEASRLQARCLRSENEVDMIKRKEPYCRKNDSKVSSMYKCLKCSRTHEKQKCPAFGKYCTICNKPNHFAVGCRFKNIRNFNHFKNNEQYNRRQGPSNRNVHEVQDSVPGENALIIDEISSECSSKMWTIEGKVNNKTINFKLDTGASCNCMPLKIFQKLGIDEHNIKKDVVTLVTYGNTKVEAVGSIIIECEIKDSWYNIKFLLVKGATVPILGLNACVKLNLIKRVDSVNDRFISKDSFVVNHEEIFDGTGKIPFEYKIKLKENYTPFVSACRRVPDTLKPVLKRTLENLIQRDIIEKVEEPTEWVNNIVIVEKADKTLRICLDPLHLNKNLCNDQFPIPTLEELSLKLKGKKIFTVLDLKEGFYHIPLDESSKKLTCFITPFGKFCFKRLPFGIKVSPEVFQRTNEKMFGDLNIGIYFDDFIIAAENEEQHDEILQNVIDRARKFNVKFNKNKLQYKVSEVKYLGQIFSKDGVKPDPSYIEAVLKLEPPNSKKDLLKVIGMLNYLTKYIPDLSELLGPLRNLIKNNTEWKWTKDHDNAFNKIKTLITKIPNLQIFDSKLPIEIQSDASQFGIGGCLMQEGKPVAFCSRSLTDTETRYPQIDKELLSICFCLNKFHNFIYGRKIKIKTDHRPLVSICHKDFYKVSGRLQRLRLKLLEYDFDIEYLPGKFMYIADLLSRSFIKTKIEDDQETSIKVHSVEIDLPISEDRLKEIRDATLKDSTLAKVKIFCEFGWPEKNKQILDSELATYFKSQKEIYERNNVLYFNDRIIIPKALRKLIMNKLHVAHLGVEKTKARARKIIFWPGMVKDIEKFIANCKVCLKFCRNPTREPLIPHDRPEIPFFKVGADILYFGGIDYLVVVDYYSNWIELEELESKTAHSVISKLKPIFARFGTPGIFISDNNPFSSSEFLKFAQKWNIKVITSSPRYPKSNGLAERAVGISKNLLRKCYEANIDIFEALLEYRTTPLSGLNVSPSELLQNRMLRSFLPATSNILMKSPIIDNNAIKQHRLNNGVYYNMSARTRDSFEEGDSVMIRNDDMNCWVPGEIIRKSDTPRSYYVKDHYGQVLRRNSSFLRSTPRSFQISRPIEINFSDNNLDLSNDLENDECVPPVSNNVVYTRAGRKIVKPDRYGY